jgi:DNA-directed RNA polymerase beta' subunit
MAVMQQEDANVNIKLQYPYSDKYEYQTYIERLDLDKVREEDIKSGKGFIIKEPKGIKNDIKLQDGIFSNRFGSTLHDVDSFIDRYRCSCGMTRGSINHGMTCDSCGTMVKFVDDDMSIFGWFVIKEPYFVIHPNLYMSLQAFIGATRLDNIINPEVEVDEDGKEVSRKVKKKDEPYKGIGMMEFRDRFDEIMQFYLRKYPHKLDYFNDLMANKDIIFTRSIPVFTTLLRPVQLDNASLKYEKTNEDYQMLNTLVFRINNTKLSIYRKKKQKLLLMYDAQTHYNNIYTELKNILSKKKGDIRSSIGGRYAFSSRSVITQGTDLMPDQVRLPYHGLCELLQQVIINILVRTYNCSYANAYKRWYKAQLTFDQVVYDIIDGLIKDSNKGLPILINY